MAGEGQIFSVGGTPPTQPVITSANSPRAAWELYKRTELEQLPDGSFDIKNALQLTSTQLADKTIYAVQFAVQNGDKTVIDGLQVRVKLCAKILQEKLSKNDQLDHSASYDQVRLTQLQALTEL